MQLFKSKEEAVKSGLPDGTKVCVGHINVHRVYTIRGEFLNFSYHRESWS